MSDYLNMEMEKKKDSVFEVPKEEEVHKEESLFENLKPIEIQKAPVNKEPVLSPKEELKRAKSYIKSLEKDKIDIVDVMGEKPSNMLNWLKASASANGASENFKAIILAMETLMTCQDEARMTANYNLKNQLEYYLSTHSKRPKTISGRQRVKMVQGILDRIEILPTMIGWENYEGNLDIKESVESHVKDHIKSAERLKIADINMNLSERQLVFNNLLKLEKLSGEQSKKAKENADWNNKYVISGVLLNKAMNSGADKKDIEKLQKERKPYLDSMIKEFRSLSPEIIDKMTTNPEFYLKNFNNLLRIINISHWIKDSAQDASYLDAFYFNEMKDEDKTELLDRAEMVNKLEIFTKSRLDAKVQSKGNMDWEKSRDVSNGIELLRDLNAASKKAFRSNYERNVEKRSEKMSDFELEFQNHYSYLKEKGMTKRQLLNEARPIYENINNIMEGFKNGNDVGLALPELKEAKRILKSGSLEERYALLVVLGNITRLDEEKILDPEYDKINNALLDCVAHVKEKGKTDATGISKEDAMRFGFMAWSHVFFAKQEYANKVANALKKLPENATEEEKYEARKQADLEANDKVLGFIWESPTDSFIVGADNRLPLGFMEIGAMTQSIPGILEENARTDAVFEQYQKDRSKFDKDAEYQNAFKEKIDKIALAGEKSGILRNQMLYPTEIRLKESFNKQLKQKKFKPYSMAKNLKVEKITKEEKENLAKQVEAELKQKEKRFEKDHNVKLHDSPVLLARIHPASKKFIDDSNAYKYNSMSYLSGEERKKLNLNGRGLQAAMFNNYKPVLRNEDGSYKTQKDRQNDEFNKRWVRDYKDGDIGAVVLEKMTDYLATELTPEMFTLEWILSHANEFLYFTDCNFMHQNAMETDEKYKNAYEKLPEDLREIIKEKDKLVGMYTAYAVKALVKVNIIANDAPGPETTQYGSYRYFTETTVTEEENNLDEATHNQYIEVIQRDFIAYREKMKAYLDNHKA